MNRTISLLTIILVALLSLLPPAVSNAEIEDSALFMEAFNSFQRKDYLFSIEKLKQLNQLFPESPLRDVSQLMIARSHQKAGDNDGAAIAINQFVAEFGTGTLAGSVDEDLLSLGKRKTAGEKLLANRQLQVAAHKVRNEQLAVERAAAMKAEQERLAREKAEHDRIAREKAEADRRERERLAAIKAARDAVKFTVEAPSSPMHFEVGTTAKMPFVIANNGTSVEEFSIEGSAGTTSEALVYAADDDKTPVQRITLKPKERFKGNLSFKMPSDRVDGARIRTTVKATSTKFNDISQNLDTHALASGPLLRAVARLQKPLASLGEQLPYRITVLNVGSQAAKEVELRITLPQQLKLVNAGDNGCWVESEQLAACRISSIPSGQMIERALKVEVRKNVVGTSGKGTVEVLQTVLQVKESFSSGTFMIKKP